MLTTQLTHAARLIPTAAVPAISQRQLCRTNRTLLRAPVRLPSFRPRQHRLSAPTAARQTASGRNPPVPSVSPELQRRNWSPESSLQDPTADDDDIYDLDLDRESDTEGESNTEQKPDATPSQPEQGKAVPP